MPSRVHVHLTGRKKMNNDYFGSCLQIHMHMIVFKKYYQDSKDDEYFDFFFNMSLKLIFFDRLKLTSKIETRLLQNTDVTIPHSYIYTFL